VDIYLDIETDFQNQITVVGFHSRATGFCQLVGSDITARRLARRLPKEGTLYTFNGHCFDLPVIRKRLGLDLRARHNSVDLRYACARAGLKGGQKVIEARLGIKRKLPGLDGYDALLLWQDYLERGAADSLHILLAYNREDVMNLARIKRYLASAGPS
jgi:uncharacterized protein YprB with RNaseH-like and TPR domain